MCQDMILASPVAIHPTDNLSIIVIPFIITHSACDTIEDDLYTTFSIDLPFDQVYLEFGAVCLIRAISTVIFIVTHKRCWHTDTITTPELILLTAYWKQTSICTVSLLSSSNPYGHYILITVRTWVMYCLNNIGNMDNVLSWHRWEYGQYHIWTRVKTWTNCYLDNVGNMGNVIARQAWKDGQCHIWTMMRI